MELEELLNEWLKKLDKISEQVEDMWYTIIGLRGKALTVRLLKKEQKK